MKAFNACSCCQEPIKYGQETPYAGQVANMGQACWDAGFTGAVSVGWLPSGRNGIRAQTPEELYQALYDTECELVFIGAVTVPGSTQIKPNLFPILADWLNAGGKIVMAGDWYTKGGQENFPSSQQMPLGTTTALVPYNGDIPRAYGNGLQLRLDYQNALLSGVGSSISFVEDCIDLPIYNSRTDEYTLAYPTINRSIYCTSDCKDKAFLNTGACLVNGGYPILTSSEGKSIGAIESVGKGWVLAFGCWNQIFGLTGQYKISNDDPTATLCCFWERFLNNEILHSEDD